MFAILFPRQRKGLLTLSLLILADSLSHVRAVNYWNSYHNPPRSSPNQRRAQCNSDDKASCLFETSPPASAPGRHVVYPRARFRSPPPPVNCCRDCVDCMDNKQLKEICNMRGGDAIVGNNVLEEAVMSTSMTPYGLPLNGWKVIFQALLTAMNVACWLIPLKSKKMTEDKLALSLANSFSGGVFLSLAFGHLLPECIHGFPPEVNEAAPYMLCLGGYMLIFFVEKIAFDTEHILESSSKEGDKNNALANGRGAVILLGALAVHSILEMTALGLADTFGDSALLSLSIALHQPAESIALLVAFIKSGLPEADIIKYLSIFSAMGPIGVALGMAVNEFAAPIVDAIMLAVVAGTFVYVGATEVIPEEFEEADYKWKKFGALVAGIVSIFVITQYTMSLEGSH